MNTPIADFVRRYAASDTARLHMPGHKGRAFLGCEPFDITEIAGADSLYEADGIIAKSEANATQLFGSARTLFSTEGSSQCIRAMLHLCLCQRKPGTKPVVVAARNVHKAFVFACALLNFEIVWLWPEHMSSLCACEVSPEIVLRTITGSCFKSVLPSSSRISLTIYGSIRYPPFTTEEIARTSCKGVILKVWPKEPEVREAVPHFSVFVTSCLSKKIPLLSPFRSIPVFSRIPNR